MTTTETALVLILVVLLSIFILICTLVAASMYKLIGSVREVVAKAESVIDSVETAAETLKDTSGKLAIFKLIRNITNMTERKGK